MWRLAAIAIMAAGCKPGPGAASGSGSPPTPVFPEPVVIADHQPEPSAIALDDAYVYWNDWGGGIVRRAPRAGGPAVTLYEGHSEVGGRSIALAGDNIYFDEGFNIMRVPK